MMKKELDMVEVKQDYLNIKEIWKQMTSIGKKYEPNKQKKDQGNMLWDSQQKGTYVRAKHGELK